jgi:hypothetical protein
LDHNGARRPSPAVTAPSALNGLTHPEEALIRYPHAGALHQQSAKGAASLQAGARHSCTQRRHTPKAAACQCQVSRGQRGTVLTGHPGQHLLLHTREVVVNTTTRPLSSIRPAATPHHTPALGGHREKLGCKAQAEQSVYCMQRAAQGSAAATEWAQQAAALFFSSRCAGLAVCLCNVPVCAPEPSWSCARCVGCVLQ